MTAPKEQPVSGGECDDCFVWTDLKNAPENMPSRAAILGLVRAANRVVENMDGILDGRDMDLIYAIAKAEKQMRIKK